MPNDEQILAHLRSIEGRLSSLEAHASRLEMWLRQLLESEDSMAMDVQSELGMMRANVNRMSGLEASIKAAVSGILELQARAISAGDLQAIDDLNKQASAQLDAIAADVVANTSGGTPTSTGSVASSGTVSNPGTVDTGDAADNPPSTATPPANTGDMSAGPTTAVPDAGVNPTTSDTGATVPVSGTDVSSAVSSAGTVGTDGAVSNPGTSG